MIITLNYALLAITYIQEDNKRMKRNWIAAIMLGIMLTLITACGGGNAQEPSPSSSASSGEEASQSAENGQDNGNEAAQERTVASEKGDIVIPANPKRVIGLSVVYPEFLYALGITPVAVQNYHDDFPAYLAEPFKDTIKMGIAKTPDFEALLAADPDVILAPAWWSEKDYDQLKQIAPTVLLPSREDWKDELKDIAAVFGKEAEAEKVIADLKVKEEEAAKKLDELVGDETVLYMRVMAKEIVLHGENLSRGSLVHKQLGLKPLENFPQSEAALSISLEVLPEYNADHLIVQLDDENNEAVKQHFNEMLDSALWKSMKAVQKDQIYMVGGKEWFNVGMAPLADSYAIDAIVKAFSEKLQ
jgi:iron complex transport system substrate-binding protein